ncbi:MAG: hypothetical protein AUG49_01490 [Catenulispora sp. 13_1_20CM_3_70_7]|nr:MAG: hypothetical protein AUG49_01490 [Catenulispora sp. 13_1_20CM_3_70_7]
MPPVAKRADRVVLAIHDELYDIARAAPLLAGVEVITKSDARGTVWPRQTRWERLMSLPAHLNASAIATPMSAYLTAPGTQIQIPAAPAGSWNVGVAWRSTPRRGFANRSIPRTIAAKLAATDFLRPLVLHRDQDVGRLPGGAVSVGIRDFADTAAVIAQCRYVVTADTVTAHLAPALGVPTIICLRHLPDWRWGAPAAPTTWYDTARLTFQKGDEHWQSVLDQAVRTVTAAMPEQQ